jgi:GT2 family glycosyltransferase
LWMYVEDEELCWRVWAAGGRVAVAEDAHILHAGGTATEARWSRPAIALRTVSNRARMVRWHAGVPGLVPFAAETAVRALRKRRE